MLVHFQPHPIFMSRLSCVKKYVKWVIQGWDLGDSSPPPATAPCYREENGFVSKLCFRPIWLEQVYPTLSTIILFIAWQVCLSNDFLYYLLWKLDLYLFPILGTISSKAGMVHVQHYSKFSPLYLYTNLVNISLTIMVNKSY